MCAMRARYHQRTNLLPYCPIALLPSQGEAGRVGRAEVVPNALFDRSNNARVERAPDRPFGPGLASQEFLAQLQCARVCGPQRP